LKTRYQRIRRKELEVEGTEGEGALQRQEDRQRGGIHPEGTEAEIDREVDRKVGMSGTAEEMLDRGGQRVQGEEIDADLHPHHLPLSQLVPQWIQERKVEMLQMVQEMPLLGEIERGAAAQVCHQGVHPKAD
jgi:hypothetical protein